VEGLEVVAAAAVAVDVGDKPHRFGKNIIGALL